MTEDRDNQTAQAVRIFPMNIAKTSAFWPQLPVTTPGVTLRILKHTTSYQTQHGLCEEEEKEGL